MLKRIVLCVVLLYLAAPVSAQVLFSMDDATTAPTAGWPGVVPVAPTHARARLATGGPNGEPVHELRQLYAPSLPGYGGEYYWGWSGVVEPSDPPQGARRFYRWRMWFSPGTDFRGRASVDGSLSPIGNKLLMVGDGCGRNSCRVVVGYRGQGLDGPAGLSVMLDGGVTPTPIVDLPVGQWLDIQVEADSATTTASADGAFKLWVNNNDYSRPTAQITGIQLNTNNWRSVFLGAYNNHGLSQDGEHTFRVGSFQVAASFDPLWDGGQSPPPPPAPVDCVLSSWTLSQTGTWGACTNGMQSRIDTFIRSIVTPASNGGSCTGALTEQRTVTQACAVTPPPPPPPAPVGCVVPAGYVFTEAGSGRSRIIEVVVSDTTRVARRAALTAAGWVDFEYPSATRLQARDGCIQ